MRIPYDFLFPVIDGEQYFPLVGKFPTTKESAKGRKIMREISTLEQWKALLENSAKRRNSQAVYLYRYLENRLRSFLFRKSEQDVHFLADMLVEFQASMPDLGKQATLACQIFLSSATEWQEDKKKLVFKRENFALIEEREDNFSSLSAFTVDKENLVDTGKARAFYEAHASWQGYWISNILANSLPAKKAGKNPLSVAITLLEETYLALGKVSKERTSREKRLCANFNKLVELKKFDKFEAAKLIQYLDVFGCLSADVSAERSKAAAAAAANEKSKAAVKTATKKAV